MNNQLIDAKCFLVNIRKKEFEFKDKWGGVKTGEERNLHKVYQKKYRTDNFVMGNVLSDGVIYGSSFHEVKNKAMKIAKKDAVDSNKKMIEERSLEEAEVIKKILNDRLTAVKKEIVDSCFVKVLGDLNWEKDRSEDRIENCDKQIHNKPFGEITDDFISEQNKKKVDEQEKLQKICEEIDTTINRKNSLEKEVRELKNRLDGSSSHCSYDEERWLKETAKTLHEDLSLIIETSLVEDYEIKIKELKYIVVGSRSVVELTEKVNDHLDKGWNLLGGIQVGGAGGGDGTQRDWSEFQYVQSLTCGS